MDDCEWDEHPFACVTEVRQLPQECDVVCLGGAAGEPIAVGLQDTGLTLAVVERELVGGKCPYWGCLPSKTLLCSSETLTAASKVTMIEAGPTLLGLAWRDPYTFTCKHGGHHEPHTDNQ